MTPNTIEQQILELVEERAEGDREITPDSLIAGEAGLDSVTVMDVILELEDRFDVTIPLDRVADVRTIADLAAAVSSLKAEEA